MESPNLEQTASLFSLMIYSFLDPVIMEASRVPHLPYERLPALSDRDYAKNLVARAFPVSGPPHVNHDQDYIYFASTSTGFKAPSGIFSSVF